MKDNSYNVFLPVFDPPWLESQTFNLVLLNETVIERTNKVSFEVVAVIKLVFLYHT